MKDYLYTVRVIFNVPIRNLESPDEKPLIGYYRKLGVSAATKEDALSLIRNIIRDGELDLQGTTVISEDQIPDPILAKKQDCKDSQCWYSSGRILFPEDQ